MDSIVIMRIKSLESTTCNVTIMKLDTIVNEVFESLEVFLLEDMETKMSPEIDSKEWFLFFMIVSFFSENFQPNWILKMRAMSIARV